MAVRCDILALVLSNRAHEMLRGRISGAAVHQESCRGIFRGQVVPPVSGGGILFTTGTIWCTEGVWLAVFWGMGLPAVSGKLPSTAEEDRAKILAMIQSR